MVVYHTRYRKDWHTQRQRYGKTVMCQDVSPPFVKSPTPFIRQTLHSSQTYIVGKHHSQFPDVVLGVDWAQPGEERKKKYDHTAIGCLTCVRFQPPSDRCLSPRHQRRLLGDGFLGGVEIQGALVQPQQLRYPLGAVQVSVLFDHLHNGGKSDTAGGRRRRCGWHFVKITRRLATADKSDSWKKKNNNNSVNVLLCVWQICPSSCWGRS